MITEVKVQKAGAAYLPKALREMGWIGDIKTMPNDHVWVWLHPKASRQQVRASLELVMRMLELQQGNGKETDEKTIAA